MTKTEKCWTIRQVKMYQVWVSFSRAKIASHYWIETDHFTRPKSMMKNKVPRKSREATLQLRGQIVSSWTTSQKLTASLKTWTPSQLSSICWAQRDFWWTRRHRISSRSTRSSQSLKGRGDRSLASTISRGRDPEKQWASPTSRDKPPLTTTQ